MIVSSANMDALLCLQRKDTRQTIANGANIMGLQRGAEGHDCKIVCSNEVSKSNNLGLKNNYPITSIILIYACQRQAIYTPSLIPLPTLQY